MSKWNSFAKFECKDLRDDGQLEIFAIFCHAKLIGCDEDNWAGSGLEVVLALVGEELNATEFGGGLIGDTNKEGTEEGNVSKYDLVGAKDTIDKDIGDAIVGGD